MKIELVLDDTIPSGTVFTSGTMFDVLKDLGANPNKYSLRFDYHITDHSITQTHSFVATSYKGVIPYNLIYVMNTENYTCRLYIDNAVTTQVTITYTITSITST